MIPFLRSFPMICDTDPQWLYSYLRARRFLRQPAAAVDSCGRPSL